MVDIMNISIQLSTLLLYQETLTYVSSYLGLVLNLMLLTQWEEQQHKWLLLLVLHKLCKVQKHTQLIFVS